MYGWRARVGLILPGPNVVLEPEFNKVAPEGVSIHATRMYGRRTDVKTLLEYEERIEEAAMEISTIRPTVVVYGCTAGSLIKGVGYDQELIEKIKRVVKVPVTTTSTSVIKAFRELDINRVSVATPYPKEYNEKEKEFFEGHGIEVLNIEGLGIEEAVEIGDITPIEVYRFSKKIFKSEADGLFISCTNLRTLEVIQLLEKDLNKPVVTSNQATIWNTLKLAGIQEPIRGYGRLLEKM